MEEAGEVVDVGPEEDAAGGAGSQREAEEPLQGGFGLTPEPSRVADLGGGRYQDSGEDDDGGERHGEAVKCGEGTDGDGAVAAEKSEREVEEEGEEEVGGDGGEEEGPRGAP